jgi:signal recognition particle GTPase
MSAFIPDEFIQRLLDETDIVSLVDSLVPLNKKGKDHLVLANKNNFITVLDAALLAMQ